MNQPLSIRGNAFVGVVKSAKAKKTALVERVLTHFVPKYERYKKVKSQKQCHVPDHLTVREGDTVRVGETRKISKTKSFVVMEIVKKASEVERRHVLDEESTKAQMHAKVEKNSGEESS